jgi:hypothetical protein
MDMVENLPATDKRVEIKLSEAMRLWQTRRPGGDMLRPLFVAAAVLAGTAQAADISPNAIAAHMKFLASDLLEGRAAGSRGHEIAAAYVASQFEAAGVEPGAGSSFFQTIPFRSSTVDPRSSVTVQPDRGAPLLLKFGDTFVTGGDPLHADRTVTGRLVVVGFGVSAPEWKHDDYAGVDVRDKIVVVFSGAPSRMESTVRAHYSSSSGKIDNAAAHGAAGMIVLERPDDDSPTPWAQVARNYGRPSMHWLAANGEPHGVNARITNSIRIHPDTARALFALGGTTPERVGTAVGKGTFRAFELPASATIRTITAHQRVESPNVVGLVRGSDPKLRDEYVVVSSHLDHIGITAPVDGDAINNGAFDNASGIAAMIEIARGAAQTAPRPLRSILFLATTAEERGLRGADYFANNPTVPRPAIVANVNIDQIMMMDAVSDVIVHGIDHSSLGQAARAVSAETGITITPDPFPEEAVFVRSDQYPFIRQGIPALYIDAGVTAVDPAVDARGRQRRWLRERYHRPNDDLLQKMDFSVPAMLGRFTLLTVLEIASMKERPEWNRGDFFAEKFGRR